MTDCEKLMAGLPALHSVAKCPKCGAHPYGFQDRDGRELTGFGLCYQDPWKGCTSAVQVSGAMTRRCPCGYEWAERPLDVPGTPGG